MLRDRASARSGPIVSIGPASAPLWGGKRGRIGLARLHALKQRDEFGRGVTIEVLDSGDDGCAQVGVRIGLRQRLGYR